MRTRGPVQPTWWSPAWIPFTDCGQGDIVCVDMHPAPGGEVGQLVWYQHDFQERVVLYPSLVDWLRELADDFEANKYVYHPDDEGPTPIEDPA